MSYEDDRQFEAVTGDQFGKLEKEMGREAYEANVEMGKAQAENVMSAVRHNDALTLMMNARAHTQGVMASAISGLALLVLIAVVPCILMFWVYLFKLWVL